MFHHFALYPQSVLITVFCVIIPINCGHAANGTVGLGTALHAERSRVRFPMKMEFFYSHNPSGRTMALGLTHPLTEVSTKNVLRCKGGRCVVLTTLPPSCVFCPDIWEPQPAGTLWTCNGIALRFYRIKPIISSHNTNRLDFTQLTDSSL
jgi:hypothetical protein